VIDDNLQAVGLIARTARINNERHGLSPALAAFEPEMGRGLVASR